MSRISASPAMSWSRTSTIAAGGSRRRCRARCPVARWRHGSCHGSRRPRQQRSVLSARSLARPISVAAVRCGTWDTTATSWSWRSGDSADDPRLPSDDHDRGDLGEHCVVAVGYRGEYPDRPVEEVGWVTPARRVPNRPSDGHRRNGDSSHVAQIAAFTLPTSVTAPVVSARARLTWSAAANTGTATKVISAVGSTARTSTTPRSSASAASQLSRSSPATCQPSSRRRSATDPPIRPRPMTFARRAGSVTAIDRTVAGLSDRLG